MALEQRPTFPQLPTADIDAIVAATKEPTGFNNPGCGTMSIDNPTNTVTFSAIGETYWIKGKGHVLTAALTLAIDDTIEGAHYIYLDNDEVLKETTTWSDDLLSEYALVMIVSWSVAGHAALLDPPQTETHGIASGWGWHKWAHDCFGALWENGLQPTGHTIGDGSLDVHAQYGWSSGEYHDEDIEHELATVASPATVTVLYMTGATGSQVWNAVEVANYGILNAPAGRVYWNELALGVWGLKEATDNDFVNYHAYTAPNGKRYAVMGQAEYANKNDAQAGAEVEAGNIITTGLPVPELLLTATHIYQTKDTYGNAVKAKIVVTDDGGYYVNWLNVRSTPGSGIGDVMPPLASGAEMIAGTETDARTVSPYLVGLASLALGSLAQIETYYVSKAGSDATTDGKNPNTPFLTFTAALAQSVTDGPPSITNPHRIYCQDGAIYTESLTLTSWQSIDAKAAHINGNHVLAEWSAWHSFSTAVSSGIAFSKITGTQGCNLRIDHIVCTGSASAVLCTAGWITGNFDTIITDSGWGVGSVTTSAILNFRGNSITTATGICVGAGGSGAEVGFEINHLECTGAGTILQANAGVHLAGTVNHIVCPTGTVWNVAATAQIDLFCTRAIDGTKTVASGGIVNLSTAGAGTNVKTIDATAGIGDYDTITEAIAAGDATVLKLGAGTFTYDAVTHPAGVLIDGMGEGVTILQTTNTTDAANVWTVGGAGCELRNLTMKCAAGSSVKSKVQGTDQLTCRNVTWQYQATQGWKFECGVKMYSCTVDTYINNSQVFTLFTGDDSELYNCYIKNNDATSTNRIFLLDTVDLFVKDCIFEGLGVSYSLVSSTGSSTNAQFAGCTFSGTWLGIIDPTYAGSLSIKSSDFGGAAIGTVGSVSATKIRLAGNPNYGATPGTSGATGITWDVQDYLVQKITASYTVQGWESRIECDSGGAGAITITMCPVAQRAANTPLEIVNTNEAAAPGIITINRVSPEFIYNEYALSYKLTARRETTTWVPHVADTTWLLQNVQPPKTVEYNNETTALTPGMTYYRAAGVWTPIDADAAVSVTGRVAMAMGSTPKGGLMRDGEAVQALTGTNVDNPSDGATLWGSTTAGNLDTTAPGSGKFKRAFGYCLETSDDIWFHPSPHVATVP